MDAPINTADAASPASIDVRVGELESSSPCCPSIVHGRQHKRYIMGVTSLWLLVPVAFGACSRPVVGWELPLDQHGEVQGGATAATTLGSCS